MVGGVVHFRIQGKKLLGMMTVCGVGIDDSEGGTYATLCKDLVTCEKCRKIMEDLKGGD